MFEVSAYQAHLNWAWSSKIPDGQSNISAEPLVGFVNDVLATSVTSVSMDEPLFSSGLIDSMSFLALIEFVEEAYGISVEISEISLEKWDSIEAIFAYIQRKQG